SIEASLCGSIACIANSLARRAKVSRDLRPSIGRKCDFVRVPRPIRPLDIGSSGRVRGKRRVSPKLYVVASEEPTMPTQSQIRDEVTQKIIAALESNLLPWRRPWNGGSAQPGRHSNVATKRAYAGLNPMLLEI